MLDARPGARRSLLWARRLHGAELSANPYLPRACPRALLRCHATPVGGTHRRTRMSEAQNAYFTALNARCTASPREAARELATLCRDYTYSHAKKEGLLYNSAILNHAGLVRLLLADGISPNFTQQADKLSPLHVAAQNGSIDALRLLLEAGADANSCDRAGNTSLSCAINNGHLACASELIPHTDLRVFNAAGHNVLQASIVANQLESFRLLLPHFADDIDVRSIKPRPPANPRAPYDATPLMLACQFGYHAMVKALLAAGASRTAHSNTSAHNNISAVQFSCLHAAAQSGHLACVIGRPDNKKMSPAEVDARDSKGRTPLIFASWKGHRYCCAALLAAGADPAAVTLDGETALDAARHFHPGDQELIELLECRGGGPAPLLCAGCGASEKRLRTCSACGSRSFCSDACMAQFWPAHKAECKRIQAEKEEQNRRCIHKI